MTLEFEPLDGPFGIAARGVEVAEISGREFKALTEALYAHRLLVIRDQDCGRDDYLAFGRRWGTPLQHVLDHLRMPGFPELLVLGNTEAKDRDDSVRNGAAYWHTDQSYTANPVAFTLLYSRHVPAMGGETLIADMAAAYDALDAQTRARIDGLVVVHLRGAAKLHHGEHATIPFKDAQQAAKVPAVTHPLVRRHPATGRKMLYAVAGTATRIEGMPADESAELLEQLKAHATSDQFVYARRHSVGDIAMIDTNATLHSATPIPVASGPVNSRVVWRISLHGPPETGWPTPDSVASPAA